MHQAIRKTLAQVQDKAYRSMTRLRALIVAMWHGDSQNRDRRNIAAACLSVSQAAPHLRARGTGFADMLILLAATLVLLFKGRTRYRMPIYVSVVGSLCVAGMLTKEHVFTRRHKTRERSA